MRAQAIPPAKDAGGFCHDVLPADGITAFGSGRSWESSEDDGGGPFHRIQVDESAARSTEIELQAIELQASPILNNSSFTFVQNNEQPPSNRSPSNIDTETESIVVEGVFDWLDMHKTFLTLAFEEFLAISAIRFGASGSVPENVKILLSSVELCSVAATILCSGGYIFERRKAKLARMMTAGGVVAMACTLVPVVGSLLANFK